jgi:23S rRNA pseudouridine2457 synthase
LPKLIIFNKPFQVMSQFTDQSQRKTLADFIEVPDVYPAGRLDYDSEGLMLLTDNGALQAKISHPKNKLKKTYWVQVEGIATSEHCAALLAGVDLKDGLARAHSCKIMSEPSLWARNPPIRERKTVSDSWIELVISEGRNRQVRRMTAAVKLPTLRLVRSAIAEWSLGDLQPGQYRITG